VTVGCLVLGLILMAATATAQDDARRAGRRRPRRGEDAEEAFEAEGGEAFTDEPRTPSTHVIGEAPPGQGRATGGPTPRRPRPGDWEEADDRDRRSPVLLVLGLLIGCAVVAGLAAGGYFWWKAQQPPERQVQAPTPYQPPPATTAGSKPTGDSRKDVPIPELIPIEWLPTEGAPIKALTPPPDSFAGPPSVVDGFRITTARGLGSLAVRTPAWGADGQSLYAVCDRLKLYHLDVPSFKVRAGAELPPASYLSRCRLGLLVSLVGSGEAWLLDEHTLTLKQRLKVPAYSRLVSAPGLNLAVCGAGSVDGGKALYGVDLDKRNATRLAGTFIAKQPGALVPVMSPDGRFVVVGGAGSGHALARLRFEGQELVPEQTGPRLQAAQALAADISPDGSHVQLPRANLQGEVARADVYSLEDLTRSAAPWAAGRPWAHLAWAAGLNGYYALEPDGKLLVLDRDGRLRATCSKVWEVNLRLQNMVVGPDGRSLLIVGGEVLYWIEPPVHLSRERRPAG
jgi:hypothetical protein